MLTKRAERAATWTDWPDNLWFGVSVEDRRNRTRIDHLRRTGARVKWISFEPLLEELMPYDLDGVDWGVVGGESGEGFRPMPMAAARSIRDEFVRRNRPFYFKQDASYVTETRPWLVEENGACWRWQQYPGNLAEPELVPDTKAPLLRVL
jgi:protein gp37